MEKSKIFFFIAYTEIVLYHPRATSIKLRKEGTGEAYFLYFSGNFLFLFKYIQMSTKISPKPSLLVQY